MARGTDCYVDTSVFIAFMDRSDSFHALLRRLFSAPPPLVTSLLVVAEGHGWFLRRYDRHRAIQFLAFIDALPNLTIRGFDASELAKTGRIVKKFSGRGLTLADAHGLAIMRELRIGCCWSTDRHLGLDGKDRPARGPAADEGVRPTRYRRVFSRGTPRWQSSQEAASR